MVGGAGILGTSLTQQNYYFWKKYSDLPSHGFLYFTATFFAIDTWDAGIPGGPDYWQINFDGVVASYTTLAQSSFYSGLCGTYGSYLPNIKVYAQVPHTYLLH